MALTEKQKRDLHAMLRPMVREALTDEIAPVIQAEIRGLAESTPSGGYMARILNGSGPARRSSDLPEAARVFARLGLIQAASQGDRAAVADRQTTLPRS